MTDKKDEEINEELMAAIERANAGALSIEEKVVEIQSSVAEAREIQEEMAGALGTSKTNTDEISAILSQAKTASSEILQLVEKIRTDSAQTAEIARTADEKDERVKEYEEQLSDLIDKYDELNTKLNDLLPAATGVGLAKSFNARKKDLQPQINRYFLIYILSIIGLIALGIWALISAEIKSISDFVKFALERSPIIVGLILLEEFSRRQFRGLVRLEEDYAYKETLSIAFDGYKKALEEVDGKEGDNLAKALGVNVLGALNQRPGRLIEIEKEQSVPIDVFLKELSSGGDSGNSLKNISNVISVFTSSIKYRFTKLALLILLIFIAGIGIGIYLAGSSSSYSLNVNSSVNADNKDPNKK